IEEEEAVDHRQLALVHQRVDLAVTLRHMNHPERRGHLTAADERDDPGEEADQDQQSADELDPTTHQENRRQWMRHLYRGPGEDLLAAVEHEHQSADDPQQCERLRGKTTDHFRHTTPRLRNAFMTRARLLNPVL